MMSSEERLEEALSAYNSKISNLEDAGDSDDLLEAYINRGTVLMMMESYVAAESDFEEAIETILFRERKGIPTDLGLFIRAYENHGQLFCGNGNDIMVADYARIADRLPELKSGTRYFSLKDIVIMCINCAEDLMDEGYHREAMPFLTKASESLSGKNDVWSDNRRMDVEGIIGEALKAAGDLKGALDHYEWAVRIGQYLYDHDEIEDPYLLTLCYMYRGDVKDELGDAKGSLDDHMIACDMLEGSVVNGATGNKQMLVDLCQDIASRLMEQGNIEKSEKYLLKSMRYGLPEMDEAIGALGIKRPDE